jgi:hypothetical protein
MEESKGPVASREYSFSVLGGLLGLCHVVEEKIGCHDSRKIMYCAGSDLALFFGSGLSTDSSSPDKIMTGV